MQKWIERTAWILLAGILFWLWNGADRDASELAHLLEDQQSRMERQSGQLDSLAVMLNAAPDASVIELKRDLMSKPEVIRVPGVHGGTMRIFSESDIRILNDQWVYAQFDDGHIQGAGLFSHSRGQDGRITWTMLESYQF